MPVSYRLNPNPIKRDAGKYTYISIDFPNINRIESSIIKLRFSVGESVPSATGRIPIIYLGNTAGTVYEALYVDGTDLVVARKADAGNPEVTAVISGIITKLHWQYDVVITSGLTAIEIDCEGQSASTNEARNTTTVYDATYIGADGVYLNALTPTAVLSDVTVYSFIIKKTFRGILTTYFTNPTWDQHYWDLSSGSLLSDNDLPLGLVKGSNISQRNVGGIVGYEFKNLGVQSGEGEVAGSGLTHSLYNNSINFSGLSAFSIYVALATNAEWTPASGTKKIFTMIGPGGTYVSLFRSSYDLYLETYDGVTTETTAAFDMDAFEKYIIRVDVDIVGSTIDMFVDGISATPQLTALPAQFSGIYFGGSTDNTRDIADRFVIYELGLELN